MVFSRSRALLALAFALTSVAVPAPVQAEGRLSCILSAIKQSFPVAAVREGSGLVRSPFKRLVFEASGGRIYKDLAPYFGEKAARAVVPLTEVDAPLKLLELDRALAGKGFPDIKARQGGWFHQWKSATHVIAKQADVDPADVSDLVIFHDKGQIAFAKKGSDWVPVELKATAGVEAKGQVVSLTDQRFAPAGASDLDQEYAVRDFAKKHISGAVKIRRMSPATNDMRYPRDSLFEWDGEIVNTLRDNGGRSLPHLQELTRAALREGIAVDSAGHVSAIPEVRKALHRMYDMADLPGRAKFDVEFDRAMERSVFHELAYRSMGSREALVRKFLESSEYERLATHFVDRHVGYIGATQYEIAQAMLADISLYRFERTFQGVAGPATSYSQKPLSTVEGYHDAMLKWQQAHASDFPEDIAGLIKELGGTGPFPQKLKYDDDLKKMVAISNGSLRNLAGQLKRHPTHQKLTGVLGRAGFITDDRRSFPNNLIGNVGLGKAKEGNDDIYTLAAFLDPQRADGYLGAARAGYRELRPFKPSTAAVSDDEIVGIFKELVNAEDFGKQRDLIEKYAEQLSAYLIRSENSPEMVQNFAKTVYGDRLAHVIFPKTSVHDPNVISRFFSESYSEFEKMARYRYLFDLTHGLTTELVKQKLGLRKHVERSLSGKWKVYPFQDLKDKDIVNALKTVLKSGDHRLQKLSQKHVHGVTPVDAREELEVWFGWDTYDMKFLKQAKNSDQWESLGAGWSCICFIRKTIFNADVLRQF